MVKRRSLIHCLGLSQRSILLRRHDAKISCNRPLCVGRRNRLHLGRDGALRPTAVLLSVTTSLRRHGLYPWAYLKHVLTELPARPPGTGLSDLLRPDYRRGALVSSQSKTRAGSHKVRKSVHQWFPVSWPDLVPGSARCPGFQKGQNQGRISYLLAVLSTVRQCG